MGGNAGMWLLENVSAKDLRDVTLDVLNDHLKTHRMEKRRTLIW